MHGKLMAAKLDGYLQYLKEKERCDTTRNQYKRDIRKFLEEIKDNPVTKEAVLEYKESMQKKYKPVTVNVKIAALNGFFEYLGKKELKVQQIKIQKRAYCSQKKELTRKEYWTLVKKAEETQNEKMSLILQTICGTGIRVSELQYITAEAVRRGEAIIQLKGKIRTILIADKLQKRLMRYIRKMKIGKGPVFVTRNKKPLDRSNIWKMMKALCRQAGIGEQKVFPHNLRHLFARCFYEADKDIARLADVLGHTNINTTRIYIMTSGGEHNKKIDRLGLIF